jgi:hypothetical protein
LNGHEKILCAPDDGDDLHFAAARINHERSASSNFAQQAQFRIHSQAEKILSVAIVIVVLSDY